jgi:hypothetical protein
VEQESDPKRDAAPLASVAIQMLKNHVYFKITNEEFYNPVKFTHCTYITIYSMQEN